MCCTPDTRKIFKASNWSIKSDQKCNSLVSEPSFGKPQPGYRLPRSWVRIPRGHRLVSVLVVSYSDYFWRHRRGGFFPVLFAPQLQQFTDCQVYYTTSQIYSFKIDLFNEIIGLLEISCKECQWLGQSINTDLHTRWRTHWHSCPLSSRPLQLCFPSHLLLQTNQFGDHSRRNISK